MRFYSPMETIGGGIVLEPNPKKKKRFDKDAIEEMCIRDSYIDLLYDPQTSGGLLISVSPEYVDDIMKADVYKRQGDNGYAFQDALSF